MPSDSPGGSIVDATTALNISSAESVSAPALELLELCAFLSPDRIPRAMLVGDGSSPAPLAALADHLSLNESVAVLLDFGLMVTQGVDVAVHARVQEFVRSRMDDERRRGWALLAARVVAGALPRDLAEPEEWPSCAGIAPHALAVVDHLTELGGDVDLFGALVDAMAEYQAAIGRFDTAAAMLRRALPVAEGLVGAKAAVYATLLSRLGDVTRALGDLTGAARMVEEALEIHQRSSGQNSREVADDLVRLALVQMELPTFMSTAPGSLDESDGESSNARLQLARRNLRRALEIHRVTTGADSVEVADDLSHLATLELSVGGLEPSLQLLESAVDVAARTKGTDHPDVKLRRLLHDALADGIRAGRVDADIFRQYKDHAAAMYGGSHYRIGDISRELASILFRDDPEGAREELLTALRIHEAQSAPPHKIAGDRLLLAVATIALGDIDAAAIPFREAAAWLAGPGPPAPLERVVLAQLSEALDALVGLDNEREGLDAAVAHLLDVCGPDHPARVVALPKLGGALYREYLRVRSVGGLAGGDAKADAEATTRRRRLQESILIAAESAVETGLSIASSAAPAWLGDLWAIRAELLAARADFYETERAEQQRARALERAAAARADALEARERALAFHTTAYGRNSLSVVGDLNSLVVPLIEADRFDDAWARAEEALDIYERLLGPEHPAVDQLRHDPIRAHLRVRTAVDRGDQFLDGGDAKSALGMYRAARDHARDTETQSDDAECCARLGFVDCVLDDAAGAQPHFEDAVRLWRGSGEPGPVWRLVSECALLSARFGAPLVLSNALDPFVNPTALGGTMTTYEPSLTAGLPEGWFAKESITLLAPDGSANVIASSEPLDASIDTKQYATIQGDLLASEFPQYVLESLEEAEVFGGRRGYIRHFRWTPPDGLPITQVQLYYAHGARGYTATATTTSATFGAAEPILRAVLASLVVRG